MSTDAILDDGPLIIDFAENLRNRPFMLTATLYHWLSRAEIYEATPAASRRWLGTDQRKFYSDNVSHSFAEFDKARMELQMLVITADTWWKRCSLYQSSKFVFNLQCELCTFDEAIAHYLLSLPPAFRAQIAAPALSEVDVRAANDALEDLRKRVAAVTD